MARVENWERLLIEAIDNARARPFIWGLHDCPTFAFETRMLLTNCEDTAALWLTFTLPLTPSSSYGAGGGGDNPSTYDSSGAGGFGGSAGSRRVGSFEVVYGAVLTVSIGSGGSGSIAGYRGGDGAAGYARPAWDEKAASFTASGSVSVD